MIQFLCLGSGSSGNCYFLKTENNCILIDAGLGPRVTKKTLKDRGFSLNDIDAVFVTHDHADHIKSVGHLAQDNHIPIYATEITHDGSMENGKLFGGIKGNYCVTKTIPEDKKIYIEKQQTLHIGDFAITAFDVSHDSADCVGYTVVADGVTFCLVTDCGQVSEEIGTAISQAQYLVLEANYEPSMLENGPYPQRLKDRIRSGRGHLSNRQCGEALVKYGSPNLKHVWLCHLSEENNHPELARKTVDQVLRQNGIIAGADFELEVLKRRIASEIYELK